MRGRGDVFVEAGGDRGGEDIEVEGDDLGGQEIDLLAPFWEFAGPGVTGEHAIRIFHR
jgi:hypothetical protein